MTKRVPGKPAHDFSDLERAFFESTPPELAPPPADALRFDDLMDEPARPERRRQRRTRRTDPKRIESRRPRPTTALGAIERLGRAWRDVIETSVRGGRAAWSRGSAWLGPAAERLWRRLANGLSTARGNGARRVRAAFARLAAELPGERAQGKTLAATIAVVVVVVIAAGVFAERPAASAPRFPQTTFDTP